MLKRARAPPQVNQDKAFRGETNATATSAADSGLTVTKHSPHITLSLLFPPPCSSLSIASSLVGEDAKTKFLSKMGQLTTSGAMLANVFQRKK